MFLYINIICKIHLLTVHRTTSVSLCYVSGTYDLP